MRTSPSAIASSTAAALTAAVGKQALGILALAAADERAEVGRRLAGLRPEMPAIGLDTPVHHLH